MTTVPPPAVDPTDAVDPEFASIVSDVLTHTANDIRERVAAIHLLLSQNVDATKNQSSHCGRPWYQRQRYATAAQHNDRLWFDALSYT